MSTNIEPNFENPTERVLYPMQYELDKEEQMRLRGGLTLWLISMSIPMVLLYELRYVISGKYVAPNANWLLGLLGLVAMVIAGLLTSAAVRSAKRHNQRAILIQTGWAFWFALAAMVLVGWQVCDRTINPISHFGEMFFVCQGTGAFYILTTIIAVLALRGRVKRLAGSIKNYWGASATNAFVWYVCVFWALLYLLIYWL
ncbi:MAG: hypothetical protein OWQ59_11440 [Alicyclobacillaceae bacterium]|jgi:heme/copper-type cytochrome/quinol oxidase subunit 3|uniref:hypothetical protein n=1 Tax=Alicyclobacillus sp. SP_1 TaxID=2942475 RepID=UPI002158308D|nr:hypothetical protein [Alicyclobacillus sp. SP_1]MCY0889055.1 hypothetical protein [Alicyclobacillaceae bacterium]MCY0894861.1 hypothetical protein [Alicyclobacillaceae bacterium]